MFKTICTKGKKCRLLFYIAITVFVLAAAVAVSSMYYPGSEYDIELKRLRRENIDDPIEYDKYGGWANYPESFGVIEPGEYFRLEKINGAWWFITPEGNPFLSKGVTGIIGAPKSYGEENFFNLQAMKETLIDWGLNTVGPWSERTMAAVMTHSIVILDSGMYSPKPENSIVADYWSAEYADHTKKAAERAATYTRHKNLLGVFIDNEIVWGSFDYRTNKTLIRQYMEFPAKAPGREEVIGFLIKEAEEIKIFNETWETDITRWEDIATLDTQVFTEKNDLAADVEARFQMHVLDRYATLAIEALKKEAPNHLILGCRFHTYPGDALIRAAAKHFDVISMAYYESIPPVSHIDLIAEEVDIPFLIGEWTFRAHDTGFTNRGIYAPNVDTQQERALAYLNYVGEFMSRPYAVGYHWYRWTDYVYNIDENRADNIGLMNIEREPYQVFYDLVREVNRRVERWHLVGNYKH